MEIMEEVGSVALNLSDDQVSPEVLAECHKHGRLVGVYTINQPARARVLIGWGVDAIFTDRPHVMVGLVR